VLTRNSQYVLDDPIISNKHLRIYSVVYDSDKPNDVTPLVYAEDLSRNGTFWNGSLIGKGNGGFLLSDNDTLRLSTTTLFVCRMIVRRGEDKLFDLTQEQELKVSCSPPECPETILRTRSISTKTTSSLNEYLELGPMVEFIWQSSNRKEHSLHAKSSTCGSCSNLLE